MPWLRFPGVRTGFPPARTPGVNQLRQRWGFTGLVTGGVGSKTLQSVKRPKTSFNKLPYSYFYSYFHSSECGSTLNRTPANFLILGWRHAGRFYGTVG